MCSDRLNHIKNIALLVIAEDEFKPEEGDVVVPSEETEQEEAEKSQEPQRPTYIGQRTQMEQTPSGERRRVYEGGGVHLKVCPVCGYANPMHIPICRNCVAIYKEIEKIVEKASLKSKSFNENNRQHRLALFSNISGHSFGLPFRKANATNDKVALGATEEERKELQKMFGPVSGGPRDIKSPNLEGMGDLKPSSKRTYGPEVLDQIWQNKGITQLGPETITEVVPTNQNRMDKILFEMNSMRDEQGDLIMQDGTPKLQPTSNWFSLSRMLKEKLSVPEAKAAGIEDAMFSMDEFYEVVQNYNRANPEEPIGHIDVGSSYQKIPSEDILPEFDKKTEVGSGGRAILQETVPDSKSAGFQSVWPWDRYTTPSGKPRVGVKQVFAERLKYVEVLKILAEKAKLERKKEHYEEVARVARENAEAEEKMIKGKKQLSLLKELRDADISSLDKPKHIIERLEKTKAHLEKNHGELLDELQDNISAYTEKQVKAIQKAIEANNKLEELMQQAQAKSDESKSEEKSE